MTLGLAGGLRNFRKLFYVFWEDLVLHGYECNHWVANSCTTTRYGWLFQDSQSSQRTLWSAVIKSPNFPTRSAWLSVRFLQWALVILVLLQTSQFRSFGKWKTVIARYHFYRRFLMKRFTRDACGCFTWGRSFFGHEIVSEFFQQFWQVMQRGSRALSMSSLLLFSVSVESCSWSSRARLRVLRLRVVAGPGVESASSESCDTDVEDVLVDELGGPAGNPGTMIGKLFFRVALDFLSFLTRCGFWPQVTSQEYPWPSQGFPSDRTAGVSSRICTVPKKCNNLLLGFWTLEHIPVQHSSGLACWACAVMLQNLQQIIFPLVSLKMALVDTKHPIARRMSLCPFLAAWEYFWPFLPRLCGRIVLVSWVFASSDLSSNLGT